MNQLVERKEIELLANSFATMIIKESEKVTTIVNNASPEPIVLQNEEENNNNSGECKV